MLESVFAHLPLLNTLYCIGLSAFVYTRNPRGIPNVFFSLGMFFLGLMELGTFMPYSVFLAGNITLWEKIVKGAEILFPCTWFPFSLTFGRSNPSGYLSRWKVLLSATYLLSGFFLSALVIDEYFLGLPSSVLDYWFRIYLMLVLTISIANFEATLRSGGHAERWQIKYLIFGLAFVFFFLIYSTSYKLLYPLSTEGFLYLLPTVVFIGCLLITFSLIRHRLADANVYVSRNLTFGSVTVLIVGGYLMLVGGIAQAIRTWGGDFSDYLSILFVFLSALFLVIALFSSTARKILKGSITRYLYKDKYDYREEWMQWTECLTPRVTIPELALVVANHFFETFWADTVVLFIPDDKGSNFKVIAPRSETKRGSLAFDSALLELLQEKDEPFDLAEESDTRHFATSENPFRRSLDEWRVRILVPLIIEDRLLGILGLSSRYSGSPFDFEDFQLMKMIGKQLARTLLNSRLTEELLESRETEAFHSFSSFVLHDLKNFTAMLTLVVENMGKRFGDPRYHEDAIRSISQTVSKMNRLMAHVSTFSKIPSSRNYPVDLNALLRECVSDLRTSLKSAIAEQYGELPEIRADADQIKKVFTNILLNAEEAIPGRGEIGLHTRVENGYVSISVSDSGCGMEKDFIENRLFRLFSTTKSTGFGIGLHHSKKIIESYGGRITVTSEPGKGSTFTILLPLTTR